MGEKKFTQDSPAKQREHLSREKREKMILRASRASKRAHYRGSTGRRVFVYIDILFFFFPKCLKHFQKWQNIARRPSSLAGWVKFIYLLTRVVIFLTQKVLSSCVRKEGPIQLFLIPTSAPQLV